MISAKRALLMHRDPALARRALDTIADVVADLLLAQVDAGADAVQLFDSWGGLLAPDEYRDFALPALQRITAKLNARKVPTLLFVRGGHHLLPLLGESGVTGFSLDWRTEWQVARELYPGTCCRETSIPVLLLGSADVIRQRTRALLETMKTHHRRAQLHPQLGSRHPARHAAGNGGGAGGNRRGIYAECPMIPLALVGMSYREAPSAVRAALAAFDSEASGPSRQLLDAGEDHRHGAHRKLRARRVAAGVRRGLPGPRNCSARR